MATVKKPMPLVEGLARSTAARSMTAVVGIILSVVVMSTTAAANRSREEALRLETEALNLARLWSGDAYHRSTSLFNAAAEAFLSDGQTDRAGSCLLLASTLNIRLANLEKADELAIRAKEIAERSGSRDLKIKALSVLSSISLASGKINESRRYYAAALSLLDPNSDPSLSALAYLSAGEHNYSYGDALETRDLLISAVSRAEQAGDRALLARSRLILGFTFIRIGDAAAALEHVTVSRTISAEANDVRGIALGDLGIGFVRALSGEKQLGLEAYERARVAFPEDVDWSEHAKASNGVATVYEEYGEFGLAEARRTEAMSLYERSRYQYGLLATLPSVADLRLRKGDLEAAESHYARAEGLARTLGDKFHIALIEEGRGNIDLFNGRPDSAIIRFSKAQAVYKELKIKFPRILGLLGRAYEKKGDLREARRLFEGSVAAWKEIRDGFAESQALFDLAKLSRRENRLETALELAQKSVALSEKFASSVLNSKLSGTYFSNVYARYEFCVDLLMAKARSTGDDRFAVLALQTSEKARARSIMEVLQLSGTDPMSGASGEIRERMSNLQANIKLRSDMLTDALSTGVAQRSIEDLDVELDHLSNEYEKLRSQVKGDMSAVGAEREFDLEQFQKVVLRSDSVGLIFSLGEERSYLWMVSPESFAFFELPERGHIEDSVEHLRALLAFRSVSPGESTEIYAARIQASDEQFQIDARRLSDTLLASVAKRVGDRRLVVVPDGKLAYFPLGVLPRPGTNVDTPLIETNEIVYQLSASSAILLPQTRISKPRPGRELIVYSDPVFSRDDPRLEKVLGPWPPERLRPARSSNRFVESLESLSRLEASGTEGESIATEMGDATILTGFLANRDTALDTAVSDFKIIHYATHGLLNETRPDLSGLVFSRFTENGDPRDEVVRLRDIYEMKLSADLVVLSACSTGVGKEVKGEGLMSLNNAFLRAGAGTVVSSLWTVDDEATERLMKIFYEEMKVSGSTPSSALRKAQLDLMRSSRFGSPYYWAPFTVQGDFRKVSDLNGASIRNWMIASAVALLAALALLGFVRRLRRDQFRTSEASKK